MAGKTDGNAADGNADSWQSFGRRRREAPEPANDPGKPPVKRSQTVSLVLLAGAGAAAFALGRVDPSQREEDVLIYPSAEACVAATVRSEADCRRDYAIARAAYPDAAPRYWTMLDCLSHHGSGRCVTGESVTASASGRFVPLMAGYVIGRRAEQELTPQPVFDHAPQSGSAAAASGHGGYCTGSGGRIWTASGGRATSARVASSVVRGTSFGGFGGTGRSFSSSSSSSRGFFGGG